VATLAEGTTIDPTRRFSAVLAGLLLAGTALAAGPMSVFRDTAVGSFNDQDMQLLRATLDKALASSGEGVPLEWTNERTGSSGVITPERSLEQGGTNCRDLRIANRHRTLQGEAVYRFCRNPAGEWRLVQ